MGPMQQCSLGPHSTSTPHFRTLCLNFPVTNQEKPIITQKALVTQSSKIVHCNCHIQKPICADFQAFSKAFSLFKLMYFNFLLGRDIQMAKSVLFCLF